MSGTQGNFIFDEKDYVSLLKFFKDLEITNQKISEYIYELKLLLSIILSTFLKKFKIISSL